MSLFRCNKTPLKFDFIGLNERDLSELTELIEKNGGEVLRDDHMPIKFTNPLKYVNLVYPQYKLYNVQFIRECIKRSFIVDAAEYRLGTPLLYDDCVMSHFLRGSYDCCNSKSMEIEVITSDSDIKSSSSSSNDEWFFEKISIKKKTKKKKKNRDRRGTAFTKLEEIEMVNYLIDRCMIAKGAKGLKVWEEMLDAGILTHRSPNSLYVRFKKNILPKIEEFELSKKQMNKFIKIRDETHIKRSKN